MVRTVAGAALVIELGLLSPQQAFDACWAGKNAVLFLKPGQCELDWPRRRSPAHALWISRHAPCARHRSQTRQGHRGLGIRAHRVRRRDPAARFRNGRIAIVIYLQIAAKCLPENK